MARIISVRELMMQRRREHSVPGKRSDPFNLWLVVESGGQAGAILGGFVSALEVLGYRDCFDGMVGSSAGSMTAAYFAGGAAAMGTTIYPEDNTDGRFLDVRRLVSGKPVMNLDYLVDEVMTVVKPLPVEVLLKSAMPVWAVGSSRTGERVLMPLHDVPRETVNQHMKMSARVPLWASVQFNLHDVWDGALSEPTPLPAALDMGATHVLHLSKMCSFREDFSDSWIDRWIIHPFLRWAVRDIGTIYYRRAKEWEKTFLESRRNLQGYYRLALYSPTLDVASLNKAKIWREIWRSFRHTTAWLGEPEHQGPEYWKPFAHYAAL